MKGPLNKSHLLSLIVAFSMLPITGFADDVTDSIDEALQYYNEGELADAVDSLNYAAHMIKEKKAEGLASFFPEPLEGWKAEDTSAEAAPAAMFGGGVSSERVYSKGNSEISINVVTDSPMMQGMMVMFSNPMFASQDGGKLKKIKRQKAIVKYDKKRESGDIMIVVANRILVQIEGQHVKLEDLMAYAEAIDYKKLEKGA